MQWDIHKLIVGRAELTGAQVGSEGGVHGTLIV